MYCASANIYIYIYRERHPVVSVVLKNEGSALKIIVTFYLVLLKSYNSIMRKEQKNLLF